MGPCNTKICSSIHPPTPTPGSKSSTLARNFSSASSFIPRGIEKHDDALLQILGPMNITNSNTALRHANSNKFTKTMHAHTVKDFEESTGISRKSAEVTSTFPVENQETDPQPTTISSKSDSVEISTESSDAYNAKLSHTH
ncbi:hypothetical protein C8R41DRAFT_866291 [Lentinula lateritia]|uniref:Uncharacterized protein n=1 Tax=Lentinula lateritia TaxID=40482 RepID=A0ABQ8VJF2_9AGAR|nr:hypothetical protein C8R41DRAFT_866291 [Lentinula lateritia]